MAISSDMSGFPKAGFPVLADIEDRIILSTLHGVPLKHLGYKIDVVGNCRILGGLVLGGAVSGITTLGMTGALSGGTTIGVSGAITMSGGNLVMTSGSILMTSGDIGSTLARINKAWLKNLELTNPPTVNGELVALISDLINLQSRKAKIGTLSNNLEIEEDGTLKLNGTATAFEDVKFDALSLKSQGGGISINYTELTVEYTTGANYLDYMIANLQLPHSMKAGSVIFPHIHFIQEENAIPNFAFQYRWQKNLTTKTTGWTALKCNTLAIAYTSGSINQIAKTASGITPPGGYNMSDIVQFRVIRDTGDNLSLSFGADPYSATVGVLSFDCHVEVDSMGSHLEYTK